MGWREDVKFGIVRVSQLFVGDGNGGLGTEFDIDELLELIGESALTFVQGDPAVAVGHGIEGEVYSLTDTDGQVITHHVGEGGSGSSEKWIELTEAGMTINGQDIYYATETELALFFDQLELNASGMKLKTGARVDTIETTLTDDDTHLPTSGAVVDAISAIPSPPEDKIFEGLASVETFSTGNGQVEVKVNDHRVGFFEYQAGPEGDVYYATLGNYSENRYFRFTDDHDAGGAVQARLDEFVLQLPTAGNAFSVSEATDRAVLGDPTTNFRVYWGTNKFELNGGNVFIDTIKSGATQVAAGAAANEVWKTNGHATLPDNVLMIGV